MQFEAHPFAEKTGFLLGFLLAFSIFTTMLYIVTGFFGKEYPYFHIVLFALGLMLLGTWLRKVLR